MERMKHRLKTGTGRKLYGLRKQTVAPVFGIIKSVMRFRQFLLRGQAPHGRVVVGNNGLEHQKDGGNDRINEYVRVRRRSLQTESHPFLRIPRHSATHSSHIRPLIPRPFGRVSRSEATQVNSTYHDSA